MTAVNILRQRDCIHVFTDAAFIDPAGVVRKFGAKCMAIPHLPAAVATRGERIATLHLGAELGYHFATFDDLIEGVESLMPVISGNLERQVGKLGNIDVFIAGWSERRGRPESYLIRTSDELPPGAAELSAAGAVLPPAFKLVELSDADAAPLVPVSEIQRIGFNLDRARADADDDGALIGEILKVMEWQRRTPAPMGEVQDAYSIGGHVLMTTIVREGVIQRVVHHWDDKLHDKIQPER